ncbi:hypothetical protein RHOER0001_2024 [Rhodococcus erythropolis SK121]|nr:hypothetical protein RHOER0001_2024 [Rhodococcus erythropolis SK121]
MIAPDHCPPNVRFSCGQSKFERMPSCVIRFSGFRRRAHPRAQTAPLGARHISLKRVRQSIIRRRRRAASLELEEILFRCCLSMPIGARPHTGRMACSSTCFRSAPSTPTFVSAYKTGIPPGN